MEDSLSKQAVYTGTLRHLVLKSHEFNKMAKNFEQWLRVFGFSDSTIYYSPAYIRSFFNFLESQGDRYLREISNNDITRYMQQLKSRKNLRNGKKLSDNYILNHLNAIKLFSRYVLESSGVLIDSGYRYSRSQQTDRTWLTRKDISCLYDNCDPGREGDMNRAILGVYYGLGLRRSEGVGLDISDIQKNNGLVYVKHAKFRRVRFIPINMRVLSDIERYIRRYRNPILKKAGRIGEMALLISEQGKRIRGNSIYSRLQDLAKRSGLRTPLSLHTLRHSLATHLMENGLNLESIASVLGHKNFESTQIYTHLIHQKN